MIVDSFNELTGLNHYRLPVSKGISLALYLANSPLKARLISFTKRRMCSNLKNSEMTSFFMTSAQTVVSGKLEIEFAPFLNMRLAKSYSRKFREKNSLKSSCGMKFFHTSLEDVQSLTAWMESSIKPL